MSKPRARELGIPFEGEPAALNAITDIPGVEVGHTTIVEGQSVRTGVTILHPRGKRNHDPVYAGHFSFNGNGEMTGAAWIDEGGLLEGPIGITNTHSVGVVRDTIVEWQVQKGAIFQKWSCPVVGETADGWLNEMNGFHVKAEHVMHAIESAASGPIAEGSVGGGTGMISFEFKAGIGTASRKIPDKLGGWSVGALVQANFGRRHQLTISGVPVGKHLHSDPPFTDGKNPLDKDEGSLIVILATDAPLLPHQLKRLAKRASLGMARTGSLGGNGSGDIYLAFSTANPMAANPASGIAQIQALSNEHIDPILFSCVYATEEAIVNAMIAAETMTGRDGLTIQALPHKELQSILTQYGR